jgi:hypothetical protein
MISKIRISMTFVNVSKYVNISKKFQGVFVASLSVPGITLITVIVKELSLLSKMKCA